MPPPPRFPQSVAIVLTVASFIVMLAALVNERNRVIHWTVLGSSFAAAAAIFITSAFALRFANQFSLKKVLCLLLLLWLLLKILRARLKAGGWVRE